MIYDDRTKRLLFGIHTIHKVHKVELLEFFGSQVFGFCV